MNILSAVEISLGNILHGLKNGMHHTICFHSGISKSIRREKRSVVADQRLGEEGRMVVTQLDSFVETWNHTPRRVSSCTYFNFSNNVKKTKQNVHRF